MIIYGAGSLGKIILGEIIQDKLPFGEIVFFDSGQNLPELLFNKYRIIKSCDELKQNINNGENQIIIAVGHPRKREKVAREIEAAGAELVNVISDGAYISPLNHNRFEGLFAPRWSGISHDTTIGKCCILHHYCGIGHDVLIGSFVTISPLAQICSYASIGNCCFIGTGAIVSPNVKIGNHVFIGPGVVVNENMNDYETLIK